MDITLQNNSARDYVTSLWSRNTITQGRAAKYDGEEEDEMGVEKHLQKNNDRSSEKYI